jgi:two-component system, OmpR family, response regulator BaeR
MSGVTLPVIMIVEDEPKLARLLADYLRAADFATRVIGNGNDVLPAVQVAPPALILLDLMLPGRDGLSVCRDVRDYCEVPIIMVTARVEEIDRLLGLEAGADDYVCKPFSPKEVVARVKAVLRRTRMAAAPPSSSRLVIDGERFSVALDGKAIELTPVEFRLLKTLATHPGRIHTRSQLLNGLYVDHRVVTERTVDSHVKNLRRKLSDASGDEGIIRSVYGFGYALDLDRADD